MVPDFQASTYNGIAYAADGAGELNKWFMKKAGSVLVFALMLTLSSTAQKYSIKNLQGRWESADGAGIEVIDSSRIFLLYNGDKKQIVSFESNFSKSPCWFDFTVSDSAGNMSMKSLLLFVNEDLVQWQIFEEDRPANFSADKGTMVYLRRSKK